MTLNIRYITDHSGNQTSVQVPLEEWQSFQAHYKQVCNRLETLEEIKERAEEVKNARRKRSNPRGRAFFR